MKIIPLIALALLLSACGAKDISTLKKNPAIHGAVTVHGDYQDVYARVRAKVLECGNPGQYPSPMFEDKARRLIEVPIGNVNGMALYYSVQGNENGTSTVDVYSHFNVGNWPEIVGMITRGASGQCGCP